MTRVLAALDASLAARPVLAVAKDVARLLDADVEAVHVGADHVRTVTATADAAQVPLRLVGGPVVQALAAQASARDVAALVVGARGAPGKPLGHTAVEIAASLAKPVVIVPPDRPPGQLRRLLIPLEGTEATTHAPRWIVELARDAALDVIALHVHDDASLPAFTDQPQHETEAWSREFLARFCPVGVDDVGLAIRVGRTDEQVLAAIRELRVDVVAVGWAQELAAGRAPVVRTLLEHGHVPVILIPVRVREPEREEVRPSTALHLSHA